MRYTRSITDLKQPTLFSKYVKRNIGKVGQYNDKSFRKLLKGILNVNAHNNPQVHHTLKNENGLLSGCDKRVIFIQPRHPRPAAHARAASVALIVILNILEMQFTPGNCRRIIFIHRPDDQPSLTRSHTPVAAVTKTINLAVLARKRIFSKHYCERKNIFNFGALRCVQNNHRRMHGILEKYDYQDIH